MNATRRRCGVSLRLWRFTYLLTYLEGGDGEKKGLEGYPLEFYP